MYDAKTNLGYRLTATTPAGLDPMSDQYAVLYPGYRGQHDNWKSVAARDGKESSIMEGETNVAILGFDRFIKEGTPEADALIARGYKKTPWGEGILKNETIKSNWGEYFMVGYSDADYAAKKAPIYLVPMNETVCTTTGLKNGYGFKSVAN